jgi:hypothetical protein
LDRIEQSIPPQAEVIASNGFVGRFGNRQEVVATEARGQLLPIRRRTVFFVLTLSVGIDTLSPAIGASLIQEVHHLPGVRLVRAAEGIWEFKWHPKHDRVITIPSHRTSVLASYFATPKDVKAGSTGLGTRYLSDDGGTGYVLDHYYWRATPGVKRITVRLTNTMPVYVEVWNATGNFLLMRREIPTQPFVHTVDMEVSIPRHMAPSRIFTGWSLFKLTPYVPAHNNLELKVWAPDHGIVNVYSVGAG